MIQSYILEIPDFGTLDTYNSIDVSFNYSFQDLSDINSRVVEFSKTVALPGTPNNDDFFRQIFDLNVVDSYNPNKRVRCNVRIGDTTIFKGFLKLERIINNLESTEYEITIISIAKNLTELIGDSSLTDLDFTEYNHVRDVAGIIASWDNYIYDDGVQIDFQLGRGYVYPKIVYGNATDIQDRWYTFDAFPAIYVKTIWDKIFETYGYTYTSNFLQSEYFNRLIIPFTRDKLTLSEEATALRQMKAGIDNATLPGENSGSALPYTFKMQNGPQGTNPNWVEAYSYNWPGLDDESTQDFNDVGGQWDGGTFTCNKQGYYDVSFKGQFFMRYEGPLGPSGPYTGNVQYASGQMIYYYEMYLQPGGVGNATIIADSGRDASNPYGQLFFQPSDSATHASPWIDYANPLVFNPVASNIYLEPGDKIFIRIKFRQPSDTSWGGSAPIVTAKPSLYRTNNGEYTYFQVKVASDILMGDEEINMQQVVPAMKINSFMEDIINMFALSFIPSAEDENNIIIEPSEIYLKSKQKVKDWSYILDRETYNQEPTANITSRRYKYTYDSDTDYYNENYKSAFDDTYGELEVVTENEFNVKDDVLKLGFAATPDAQAFNQQSIVQPWFITVSDENQIKSKSVKPRILFYGGLQPGQFLKVMDYSEAATYTGIFNYPYCGTWDHPTTPKWDLSWGAPDKIYWDSTTYPTNNLFNQFHKNLLESVVDSNGKILTGNFFLTPAEIADIDPRDIIYIDGTHWRILNINDYNPIAYDRLTEVELIKIIDFEKYQDIQTTIPTISNSCPVDLVVTNGGKLGKVFASPSGQPITADCCASVGGTYYNGVCRVNTTVGGLLSTGNIAVSVSDPLVPNTGTNVVNTANVVVKGTRNIVGDTVKSAVILGDYNGVTNVRSAMITGNNNTIESATNISVLGNNNATTGSDAVTPVSSSQLMIVGDNNIIAEGLVGVNIFGNNIVATTGSTTYTENLNVSGSINGVPITTLITGSQGLPGVLSIDNTTGPNWIDVESGYGLTGTYIAGDITDTFTVDPEGLTNYTGIKSINNTTTENSYVNVYPNGTSIVWEKEVGGDYSSINVGAYYLYMVAAYTGSNNTNSVTVGNGFQSIDVYANAQSTDDYPGININGDGSEVWLQCGLAGFPTTNNAPIRMDLKKTVSKIGNTGTATPFSLYTITPRVGVTYVNVKVTGIQTDLSTGYYSELVGAFRYDGITTTQIGTTDLIEKSEFTTATTNIVISGTDIILEVTGETSTNIAWNSNIEWNV